MISHTSTDDWTPEAENCSTHTSMCAIPADPYKDEQQAISRQLTAVTERLGNLSVRFDDLEHNLEIAIELASNCYEAYGRAPDAPRRMYNQAFFKRMLIWEDEPADGELQDLFEVVCPVPPADGDEPEETQRPRTRDSRPQRVLKTNTWCPWRDSNPRPAP